MSKERKSKFTENLDEVSEKKDNRRLSQSSTLVDEPTRPTQDPNNGYQSQRGSLWSRLHDRWCFVLFVLNLTVYNILCIYGVYCLLTDYEKEVELISDNGLEGAGNLTKDLDVDAASMFATATALAIGMSFALLFFVRSFPGFVIWTGPALCLTMLVTATGGLAYLKLWSSAAITATMGAVVLLSLFLLKSKYRLARDMLDTANRAAGAHWSVFWTVIIGLLASGAHSIWNVFGMISLYLRFSPGQRACEDGGYCSAGLTIMLMAYILVSHMWISSVITNLTMLTMAGGPYAQWWMGKDRKDRSETWWAFKRAVTVSLGSVAFGSLLVTFFEVLAFVVKVLTGELFGHNWCSCCCICIINLLEKALEYFNKYVYIKIGVEEFEIGFIEGAKETLRFFRGKNKKGANGLTAMIGDSIVGMALHMTCIACALLSTGITWVYSTVLDGTAKIDGWWDFLVLFYCFILTLNVGLVLTSALEAGVSTVFVCIDDSPWNLKNRHSRFYERLRDDEGYWRYREAVFHQDGRDRQPQEQ